MNNKRNIILITLLLLILLGGGVYYFLFFSKVNYLIPGVPYYGFYNLFFQAASTPNIAPLMSVLGYWGDERNSNSDLEKYFAQLSATATPPTILSFFQTAGYETYQWTSSESGDVIKQIKKFVNPDKKIPVIVFQKHLTGGNPDIWPRVVIGIFDDKKKVIVHDHLLGNNYEISYQDFENMFLPNARAVLAVWPSDKIKGAVKGPNPRISYPPRLEAMDKLGPVLALTWPDAVFYRRQLKDFKKAGSLLYEELVNNPNFNYFPKAFQVSILSRIASDYISAGQLDDAIDLIKERVLPINENLSSDVPKGWFIPAVDKFAHPYFVLSLAYLKNGEKNLAIVNYKEMKLIIASNSEKFSKSGDYFVAPPLIDELEKEISVKK